MAVCNLFSNLSSTKWRFCVLQENSIAPNLTFLIVTNGAFYLFFVELMTLHMNFQRD